MIPLIPAYTKDIPSIDFVPLSELSTERAAKRRRLDKYKGSIEQDKWLLLLQDIWGCILQQLDIKSLVQLRATSKEFSKIETNFQNKYKQLVIDEFKLSEYLHVNNYSF